jgi:hypothetical protein
MTQRSKWGFVALSAVLVLAVLALVANSPASGQGKSAPADNERFLVNTQTVGDSRLATVVIDSETMRLLVYQFDFSRNQMKLMAVRDISQDVNLSRYNNVRPWPEDIREMIEAEKKAEKPAAEQP